MRKGTRVPTNVQEKNERKRGNKKRFFQQGAVFFKEKGGYSAYRWEVVRGCGELV